MTTDYEALAAIYDTLGMADFAATITPLILTYAQQHEWMGRRILDLGTGTGTSIAWFADHHYLVTGIEVDPAMLQQARARLQKQNLSADLRESDMRSLEGISSVDMVLALDSLNELASLRELEQVMTAAHTVLSSGKLFIFDLHTNQGLLGPTGDGDRLLLDDGALLVIERTSVDYERQTQHRRYTILASNGAFWERSEAHRTLRAFPVQAVMTLLRRHGFSVNSVLDTQLNPVEPGNPGVERVLLVTQKQ